MQIAKVTYESRLAKQQAINSVLLLLQSPLQLQIHYWKLLPTPGFISMLLWFKCQQQNMEYMMSLERISESKLKWAIVGGMWLLWVWQTFIIAIC